MRSERTPKKQKYSVIIVLLTIGVAVGVWHNRRVAAGKPDYAAGMVRGVVAVPARGLRSVTGWFGSQTEWITRGRRLAAENRDLRRQVDELKGQNNALAESRINYDRLRQDVGLPRLGGNQSIPADIIAFRTDPKFDTMIIGRGSNDGIKPNSVVITKDGVVGRVFEVEPGSSAVLLLTDQKSGIGTRVQRPESRAVGVCEGDNSSTLTMLGLPDSADIKLGDQIVTSGLGGVYPGGLLVGTVSELRADNASGGRIVRVKPQVRFDRLEQVYVLR